LRNKMRQPNSAFTLAALSMMPLRRGIVAQPSKGQGRMHMDLASLAQAINPIIQTVFIVVIGLGYYYTTKAIRSQVDEMARQATTGGRPLIIVSEDYENLPTISLIIQNVGPGPAKNINFHFTSPIESSDGFVLSELTLFQEGITSLAPGARIVCYWDELENLQPLLREGRLERNATVTVEYQDIAGGNYSHDWEIDPGLYEDLRTQGSRNMDDLVDAVELVAEKLGEDEDRRSQGE
jgi:hypothetical protein